MFFFFHNDVLRERFAKKAWSLMQLLSCGGGLSRAAAFDEICKLLWFQMVLHTSSARNILSQTSSIKGFYSVAVKDVPCDLFDDTLVVDSGVAEKALIELQEINWVSLSVDERLLFLRCLSYEARRLRIYGVMGNYWIPEVLVKGIMRLVDVASSRKVLFATGDSQELFAALLSRINHNDGETTCTTCVLSKSLGKFLRRIAILSGVVSRCTSNDNLISTIEDTSLDSIGFDSAIINTLVLDQPFSIIGDREGNIRRRFDLTVRYFERMFALLRGGSLVVSLIPRSLAGNSRWGATRRVIERMFKVCAVLDISGKWGALRHAPFMIVFMRRDKVLEEDEVKCEEIYLDKINIENIYSDSLDATDDKNCIVIFERLASFIKNKIARRCFNG